MNVIETCALGKRYRRNWALRDCSLTVPAGHVVALVGPNGAGKTTLLNLAAGLLRPTRGQVSVLGGEHPGSAAARSRIGFVAQDAPLYGHLPAGDMLHLARNLNLTWDEDRAQARLAELAIPLDRKVRQLSGGQRAQLALTIALAKRPEVLILDEPLASLDPLARHDVVSELERIADYLVVLNEGRLQLAGEVDALLDTHRILTGPGGEMALNLKQFAVVQVRQAGAQAHLLVRTSSAADPAPPGWLSSPASLEDLVLAYLRDPKASVLPGPEVTAAAGGQAVRA